MTQQKGAIVIATVLLGILFVAQTPSPTTEVPERVPNQSIETELYKAMLVDRDRVHQLDIASRNEATQKAMDVVSRTQTQTQTVIYIATGFATFLGIVFTLFSGFGLKIVSGLSRQVESVRRDLDTMQNLLIVAKRDLRSIEKAKKRVKAVGKQVATLKDEHSQRMGESERLFQIATQTKELLSSVEQQARIALHSVLLVHGHESDQEMAISELSKIDSAGTIPSFLLCLRPPPKPHNIQSIALDGLAR